MTPLLDYFWLQIVAFVIALLSIGGVVYAYKRSAQRQRECLLNNAPWQIRDDWATGVICGQRRKGRIYRMLIFGSLVNIGLIFVQITADFTQERAFLYEMVFFAVDLFLIYFAFRLLKQFRLIGRSVLKMHHVPGVIGGAFEGTIFIEKKLCNLNSYTVRLRSYRYVSEISGEDSMNVKSILWEAETKIAESFSKDNFREASIPARFEIPATCQETGDFTKTNRVRWELCINADKDAFDYSVVFQVPVYNAGLLERWPNAAVQ